MTGGWGRSFATTATERISKPLCSEQRQRDTDCIDLWCHPSVASPRDRRGKSKVGMMRSLIGCSAKHTCTSVGSRRLGTPARREPRRVRRQIRAQLHDRPLFRTQAAATECIGRGRDEGTALEALKRARFKRQYQRTLANSPKTNDSKTASYSVYLDGALRPCLRIVASWFDKRVADCTMLLLPKLRL